MNSVSSPSPEKKSPLDREIEAALAVDPSPEFVALVRLRISEAPLSWNAGWKLFGITALTAAIALVVFMATPHPASRVEIPQSLPASAKHPAEPAKDSAPIIHAASVRRPSRLQVFGKPVKEREVMISPVETAAIRRLLNGPPVELIEFSAMDIEPQGLPEMAFTPIPSFDPFRTEPTAPVTP